MARAIDSANLPGRDLVPLRVRLALIFAAATAVVLAVGGLVFVDQLSSGVMRTTDSTLTTRAANIANALAEPGSRPVEVLEKGSAAPLPLGGSEAQIVDRNGEVLAAGAVRTVARSLGHTVASLVNILNPERVILGGTLAGIYDFAPTEVATALRDYAMTGGHQRVQLCTPGLGSDSSLLGAAELAFSRLLADPLIRP